MYKFIAIGVIGVVLASPVVASSSMLSRLGKTAKATAVAGALAATVLANSAVASCDGFVTHSFEFVMRHSGAVRELSVAFDSDRQFMVGGNMTFAGSHRMDPRQAPTVPYRSYVNLDGEMLIASGDDRIRFPRLKVDLAYWQVGYRGTEENSFGYRDRSLRVEEYDHPGIRQTIAGYSLVGYERLNLKGFDDQGFAASHLHLFGITVPIDPVGGSKAFIGYVPDGKKPRGMLAIKSSLGINDIDFVNLGGFGQEDLEAWAGEDAGISYVFVHEGALRFSFTPQQLGPKGGYRAGSTVVAVELRDLRTIKGDIDFQDGADGDFTAVWNDITLTLSQELPSNEGWHLQGEARVYRQTIDASGRGESFSLDEKGIRGAVKVKMLSDW